MGHLHTSVIGIELNTSARGIELNTSARGIELNSSADEELINVQQQAEVHSSRFIAPQEYSLINMMKIAKSEQEIKLVQDRFLRVADSVAESVCKSAVERKTSKIDTGSATAKIASDMTAGLEIISDITEICDGAKSFDTTSLNSSFNEQKANSYNLISVFFAKSTNFAVLPVIIPHSHPENLGLKIKLELIKEFKSQQGLDLRELLKSETELPRIATQNLALAATVTGITVLGAVSYGYRDKIFSFIDAIKEFLTQQ